jgi:hypothetical protein
MPCCACQMGRCPVGSHAKPFALLLQAQQIRAEASATATWHISGMALLVQQRLQAAQLLPPGDMWSPWRQMVDRAASPAGVALLLLPLLCQLPPQVLEVCAWRGRLDRLRTCPPVHLSACVWRLGIPLPVDLPVPAAASSLQGVRACVCLSASPVCLSVWRLVRQPVCLPAVPSRCCCSSYGHFSGSCH